MAAVESDEQAVRQVGAGLMETLPGLPGGGGSSSGASPRKMMAPIQTFEKVMFKCKK